MKRIPAMEKRKFPDVQAFKLESAKKVLHECGMACRVVTTNPVSPSNKNNMAYMQVAPVYRVVRQKEGRDGVLELTVAREVAVPKDYDCPQ